MAKAPNIRLAGREKFILILAFALCTLISVLIISHNFEYSRNFFPVAIAFLFSAIVELAFVSVSIIGAISGRWNFWDRFLKFSLFVLSIVPATLETSEKIRGMVFEQWALEEPQAPPEPTQQRNLIQTEIQAIDQEIASLRDFKKSYDLKANARTWYAFQDQKRIDSLLEKRENLSGQAKKLQSEYFDELKTHQADLAKFRENRSISQKQSYFDLLFLVWALCLVWILQMLNARLSGNAALILSTEQKAENPSEQDESQENPEKQLKSDSLKEDNI